MTAKTSSEAFGGGLAPARLPSELHPAVTPSRAVPSRTCRRVTVDRGCCGLGEDMVQPYYLARNSHGDNRSYQSVTTAGSTVMGRCGDRSRSLANVIGWLFFSELT
jgi:hypothetical protein